LYVLVKKFKWYGYKKIVFVHRELVVTAGIFLDCVGFLLNWWKQPITAINTIHTSIVASPLPLYQFEIGMNAISTS